MSMFNAVLKYSNPDLDADEDDTDPSPISLPGAFTVTPRAAPTDTATTTRHPSAHR